jgi:hypothetical protein
MKSIEVLPPGLYGMNIIESKGDDGKIGYDVEFVELKLEEVMNRLNRLKRADEKPFEAVEAISEFNRRAYELFAQPLVQAFSNEDSARLGRLFHPLRFQRWAISDLNPWLWWLKPVAEIMKENRQAASPELSFRRVEKMVSELVSASFDLYRDVRDALSEATFFQVYGDLFALYLSDRHDGKGREVPTAVDPRELPYVKEALASIGEGGYPEALARVGALLAPPRGQPIPLSRMELKEELIGEYRDLLPDMPHDQMRRIRGEQDIIIRYEKEKAIETLPQLLRDPEDRKRLLTVVDRLLTDKRIQSEGVTPEQRAMLKRIGAVLSVKPKEMPLLSGKGREATS